MPVSPINRAPITASSLSAISFAGGGAGSSDIIGRALERFGNTAETAVHHLDRKMAANADALERTRLSVSNQEIAAKTRIALQERRFALDDVRDPKQAEEQWKADVEAVRRQAVDAIPQEDVNLRGLVSLSVDNLAADESLRVGQVIRQKHMDHALAGLNETVDILQNAASRTTDPGERAAILAQMEDAILQNPALNEVGRQKLLSAALSDADEILARRMLTSNPAAAKGIIDRMPNLDPMKRMSLMDAADREIKAQARIAQAEARQARIDRQNELAWEAADLDARIVGAQNQEDVEAARRDLDTLRDDPLFRPAQFTTLNNKLAKLEQGIVERDARIDAVGQAIANDVPMAVTTETKKGVDEYYAKNAAGLDPEQRSELAIRIAEKTTVMPTVFRDQVSAVIASGTPEQKVVVGRMVGDLAKRNPRSLDELPDDDRRVGVMIGEKIDAGVDPLAAVDDAVTKVHGVTDPVMRARQERINRKMLDEQHVRLVDELDDSWTSDYGLSDPDVADPLFVQFDEHFEREYMATGDADAARKEAARRIQQEWGVTRVNGERRFMRRPPEQYYGVTGLSDTENADWMREQLTEDLSGTGVDPERASLAYSPFTARSAEGPAWVVLQDGVPVPDPTNKSGEYLLHWRPDWNASKERQRLLDESQKRRDDAMGAAREEREDIANPQRAIDRRSHDRAQ